MTVQLAHVCYGDVMISVLFELDFSIYFFQFTLVKFLQWFCRLFLSLQRKFLFVMTGTEFDFSDVMFSIFPRDIVAGSCNANGLQLCTPISIWNVI
jgi:hypothetical protein